NPGAAAGRACLALQGGMNAAQALAALRPDAPVLAPGTVWLAGAGPGDPGLLTLDALAGLLQAEVVVHDALVDARVLALAGPAATRRSSWPPATAPNRQAASTGRRWPAPASPSCSTWRCATWS